MSHASQALLAACFAADQHLKLHMASSGFWRAAERNGIFQAASAF
jgi:hypothetical protein